MASTTPSPDDLGSWLLRIEPLIDGDAKLEAVAKAFVRSPFHFHRVFSKAVGETPKRYVTRLRLERAAYRLAITDETILAVGLSVGFASHETFARAFRRAFGRSPSQYRNAAKTAQVERMERMRAFRGDGCVLSEVRFEEARPTWLLAVRRLGAYAAFDPTSGAALWSELEDLARRTGAKPTPPELQQSDICIPVETRPALGDERVRCIELAGGVYGVIEHLGPYQTVSQAYRTLADGIRRSGRYAFRDGPPVHIFHRFEADAGGHAEIRFPVKRSR